MDDKQELNTLPISGTDNLLNSTGLSCKSAAMLIGVSPSTLRNYVWLKRMTKAERRKRMLQDPPEGLPLPERRRGHLVWNTDKIKKFLASRPK